MRIVTLMLLITEWIKKMEMEVL